MREREKIDIERKRKEGRGRGEIPFEENAFIFVAFELQPKSICPNDLLSSLRLQIQSSLEDREKERVEGGRGLGRGRGQFLPPYP